MSRNDYITTPIRPSEVSYDDLMDDVVDDNWRDKAAKLRARRMRKLKYA